MKKSYLDKDELEPITADSLLNQSESRRFNQKDSWILLLGSCLYFSWYYFFVGLRPEHIWLYVISLFLYFVHSKTQQFILAFSIFIIYWILYDSMRVLPNYKVNPIHIAEIYEFDKYWFGVTTEGVRLTWNEFFKINHITILDVITGFFYLNWVPIPLALGFWLFLNNKLLFLKFSYAFVFTNIVGFILYYCYPAAPPWYVEQYGFQVIHGTPGNAAGLLNFDKFFGIHLFEGMYAKNANVFAAMPSLHSAYPVLCFLYGLRLKKTWLNIIFAIFTLGIWFSAIYTRHHYVVDVLAGATTAFVSYQVFEYLNEKTILKKWFDNFVEKI